ncbi:MAG: enoyl-CoA hydratase/isomerase family protein, partial [Acidobacteriaceae bacterium]|nr:enoyl-CoA hydratase/isomerase family protein [Acidobacteriaceae bacterium]
MNELVKVSKEGDVAVLTIGNPPVNAVDPGVAEGILAGLRSAWDDPSVQAVVVMGAGQTFIAGADIRLLQKIAEGKAPLPDLRTFVGAIESSPKPVVMAIHGAAFGGGLETAMAGHYRVIAPGAQVGQPEVKLGLIPGMGGTQRLPRLAGVAKALEMCAFGEPVSAQEALKNGIVDRVIEGDLRAGAIAFAREVAGAAVPRTCDRNEKLKGADPGMFAKARETAAKLRRLQLAPLEAIAGVEAGTQLPFEQGCDREQ